MVIISEGTKLVIRDSQMLIIIRESASASSSRVGIFSSSPEINYYVSFGMEIVLPSSSIGLEVKAVTGEMIRDKQKAKRQRENKTLMNMDRKIIYKRFIKKQALDKRVCNSNKLLKKNASVFFSFCLI